jgi:aromatic ring-opening dioxygenase catalytic subunit (LigB family)
MQGSRAARAAVRETIADHMAAAAPLASRLPTLYLAHGGGPFPVLGEPGHAALAKFMKAWPATVPRPSSIIVVSAHWEVGCDGCFSVTGDQQAAGQLGI